MTMTDAPRVAGVTTRTTTPKGNTHMNQNAGNEENQQTEDDDESNGKKPTILTKMKKEWEANGKKPPNKSETEKLLKAWKTARGKADAAQTALDNAEKEEREAVAALAKAFGASPLSIDGVVHKFACRGETVYFRKVSTQEVIAL